MHDREISMHTIDELRKEFLYGNCFSGALAHRYKDIYEAWPDSKYILTIRNSDSWLNSARRHFTNGKSGMTLYREAIYGTWKVWELTDEELLGIYNGWNDKIRNFFKGKDNFMEINFIECDDKKSLMNKLLNFLELESIPGLNFPHSNKGVK